MFVGFIFLGLGLLVVGAVSAGAYFTLKGSSSDADFTEYRASLAASGHVSILVEIDGVSAGAAEKMKACAHKMAVELSPRLVDVYEKTDGDCITSQNTTLGECYESVEEPIITLRYSTLQTRPEFSVVFVDNAIFTGDEEYFEECGVAQMLAVPVVNAAPESAGNETNESGNEWVIG
jgi:predicted aconitase